MRDKQPLDTMSEINWHGENSHCSGIEQATTALQYNTLPIELIKLALIFYVFSYIMSERKLQ